MDSKTPDSSSANELTNKVELASNELTRPKECSQTSLPLPVSGLCEVCEEDKLTSLCNQCEQYLCARCATMHVKQKVSKDHVVTEVCTDDIDGESIPSSGEAPSIAQSRCELHRGCALSHVCEECRVMICKWCRNVEHRGHKNVSIPGALGLLQTICLDFAKTLHQSIERDRSHHMSASTTLEVKYSPSVDALDIIIGEAKRIQDEIVDAKQRDDEHLVHSNESFNEAIKECDELFRYMLTLSTNKDVDQLAYELSQAFSKSSKLDASIASSMKELITQNSKIACANQLAEMAKMLTTLSISGQKRRTKKWTRVSSMSEKLTGNTFSVLGNISSMTTCLTGMLLVSTTHDKLCLFKTNKDLFGSCILLQNTSFEELIRGPESKYFLALKGNRLFEICKSLKSKEALESIISNAQSIALINDAVVVIARYGVSNSLVLEYIDMANKKARSRVTLDCRRLPIVFNSLMSGPLSKPRKLRLLEYENRLFALFTGLPDVYEISGKKELLLCKDYVLGDSRIDNIKAVGFSGDGTLWYGDQYGDLYRCKKGSCKILMGNVGGRISAISVTEDGVLIAFTTDDKTSMILKYIEPNETDA